MRPIRLNSHHCSFSVDRTQPHCLAVFYYTGRVNDSTIVGYEHERAINLRNFALVWATAFAAHMVLSLFFALMSRLVPKTGICAPLRTRQGVRFGLLLWFIALIMSLAFLDVYAKISRGNVYPDDAVLSADTVRQ